MKHVDIWSKGEVVRYLHSLLDSGQIKDCNHLKIIQGHLMAFYPRCTQNWASRIPANNVTLDPTAYRAPSSYDWPECPADCPHYSQSKDFIASLAGVERTPSNTIKQAKIPTPVIAVVGEVIGNYYYDHTRLNTLFMECDAPGEPPKGNCVKKCQLWLKRCNDDPDVNAFSVLGKVIENFMETDVGIEYEIRLKGRKRVKKILAKYGLSYHQGGQIIGAEALLPSRSLKEILASRDLTAVEIEFQRAIEKVESDHATGITAACSMIESLCKVYIEDENLKMPKKKEIMELWKVVRKNLGFDPRQVEDQDIIKILSSLASVADGIGALRTHTSSAHGRGRRPYKLEPRHARLSIHAACSLVAFVIETWEARRDKHS